MEKQIYQHPSASGFHKKTVSQLLKVSILLPFIALIIVGCEKAPSIEYKQLIIHNESSVDNVFNKRSLKNGSSIDYQTKAGIINILEYVLEYPELSGYVKIEKAYGFGDKYILIVSTGQNGNSCPATTYAIGIDSKSESVTGKSDIEGCSENIESLSDGNKLTVKKEGAVSTFINGEIKQPPLIPATANRQNNIHPAIAPNKMMGDKVDDNPNAKPNRQKDVADKAAGKSWQDENGFMHFPDGSISNGPVD